MQRYFADDAKQEKWNEFTAILEADGLDILNLPAKHYDDLSDADQKKFTTGAYKKAGFDYDYVQRIVRNRIKAFKYPNNTQLTLLLSKWWKLPVEKRDKDAFLSMFQDACHGRSDWNHTTLNGRLKNIIEEVYKQHKVLIDNPISKQKKPEDAVAMLGEDLWK
tara:strand:+ start:302 stop:790 length:489 start_codon:yes stop_codon:yes gene_type:complete